MAFRSWAEVGTPTSSTKTANWRTPRAYIFSYFERMSFTTVLLYTKSLPGWMAQMKFTFVRAEVSLTSRIMSCDIHPFFTCSSVSSVG